jgi:phage-related protein
MAIVDAVPLILPPLIEAIPQIVTSIVGALMDAIPQLLQGAIQLLMAIIQVIPIIIQELIPMVPVIVETIVDGLLDCLPVLVDGAVQLLMGIIEAIPTICKVLIKEAPRIVKSIVTGLLKAIPELIKAGGELLAGLVEGMLNFDILGAVAGIGEAIIDGFKGIFQIHSPSRVMAGLGEMLDEGLAVGIEDNAKKPVKALGDLSEDMLDGVGVLNGLTLERRLAEGVGQATTAAPAEGLSQKLDQILNAILSGQVIMLDGKTLVGSTAGRYDTELGQRRVLAERGAL